MIKKFKTPIHLLLFLLFLSLLPQITRAQTTTAQVAAGSNHSLVLTEKGELYGFGRNDLGALGLGNANRIDIPQLVNHPNLAGKTIIDISIGTYGGSRGANHILMLTSDGHVYSYGFNTSGESGHPSLLSPISEPTRITASGIDTVFVHAIATGDRYSTLATNRGLYIFGSNSNGYIGRGDNVNPITTPERLTQANVNMVPFKKLYTASGGATYAIAENDSIFVHGRNANGELGFGDFINRLNPTLLSISNFGGEKVVKFAAGSETTLALTEGGKVYFMGIRRNFEGIDDISTTNVSTPQLINHPNVAGKTFVDVGINANGNGFLVASDGTVFGFGIQTSSSNNGNGELGLGDTTPRLVPTQLNPSVFQGKSITNVYAAFNTTHFRASDGTIFSTGNGGNADLGIGFSGRLLTPLPINPNYYDNKTITNIVAKGYLLFLIANDGTFYSSGFEYYSSVASIPSTKLFALRENPIYYRPTKVDLSNLSGKSIAKIRAGNHKSFILTTDGNVYGMGQAATGELGLADSMDVFVPTLLDQTHIAGKKIIDVATSNNGLNLVSQRSHTLLLAEDGTLYGFGRNTSGQLGLGDNARHNIATPITTNLAGKKIIHIAAGAQNSLAIADDGSVFLWGRGGLGEMGFVGNTNDLNVPTLASHVMSVLPEGVSFVNAAIGENSGNPHFILVASNGSVYGFGTNNSGQLGISSTANEYNPTQITDSSIAGKKIVEAMASTDGATMIRAESGEVFGFGRANTVGFSAPTFIRNPVPTLLTSTNVNHQKVVDISLTNRHSVLLMNDGRVLTAASTSATNRDEILGNSTTPSGGGVHNPVLDFTTYASPVPTGNLAVHLDANRGLTIPDGAITRWADLSGNGFDAINGEGPAFRPQSVANVINGKPAVRFSSGTYLGLTGGTNVGLVNNDYEMFIIVRSTSVHSGIEYIVSHSVYAGENELFLNSGTGATFIPKIGVGQATLGTSGQFTATTPHLYNLQVTDTFSRISIDRTNVSEIAEDGRTSSAHTSGGLLFGTRTGNANGLNGDIAEIIIYNGVLSAADRNAVEIHLLNKYAIQNYKNESAQLTGTEGWRLLSSPVADSSYASFFRGLWTQGFTGAAFEQGASNVYTWPINTGNRDSTQWTPLTNASNTFTPGQGILAYVYSDDDGPGNANNAGFPKTLRADGFSPSAEVNLNSLINPNTNGWSLVGNPFSTNIDWDLMSKPNLSQSVYVWDNTSSQWKTWNGSTGGLTNGLIGPFNGFFVQTLVAEPVLSVPLAAKVEGTSVFLGKEVAKENFMLELQIQSQSGQSNKTWIEFSENGLEGKDAFDAVKLVPLSFEYIQISTSDANGKLLDSNQLPIEFNEIEIPVFVNSTFTGLHEISFSGMNLPQDWNVELLDTETGEVMNREGKLSFTPNTLAKKQAIDVNKQPEITAQTASESRFILKIGRGTVTSAETLVPNRFELSQNYPNPFNPSTTIAFGLPEAGSVRLDVFDITGRVVQTVLNETRSAGYHQVQINASSLSSGMYFYRLSSSQGTVTKKMLLIK